MNERMGWRRADETVKEEEVRTGMEAGMGKGRSSGHRAVSVCSQLEETIGRMEEPDKRTFGNCVRYL